MKWQSDYTSFWLRYRIVSLWFCENLVYCTLVHNLSNTPTSTCQGPVPLQEFKMFFSVISIISLSCPKEFVSWITYRYQWNDRKELFLESNSMLRPRSDIICRFKNRKMYLIGNFAMCKTSKIKWRREYASLRLWFRVVTSWLHKNFAYCTYLPSDVPRYS